MGETSKIQWTQATWNPVRGCHKVSAGCDNCYMYRDQLRYGHDPETVVRAADKTFYAPLRWQTEAAKKGEQRLVFNCSWSDWFHPRADPHRDEMWDIIRACPNLTFQILTKRHGRIKRHLPRDWGDGWSNVWLGVSAEDQWWLDHRVPALLDVPAHVRFVSAEPLLEPITFWHDTEVGRLSWLRRYNLMDDWLTSRLDWVIVGGESGPHWRPIRPNWARAIRDECVSAGVAFLFKQWSGMNPHRLGRELDGRTWDQFPTTPKVVAA